jgi:hypothetical protein
MSVHWMKGNYLGLIQMQSSVFEEWDASVGGKLNFFSWKRVLLIMRRVKRKIRREPCSIATFGYHESNLTCHPGLEPRMSALRR